MDHADFVRSTKPPFFLQAWENADRLVAAMGNATINDDLRESHAIAPEWLWALQNIDAILSTDAYDDEYGAELEDDDTAADSTPEEKPEKSKKTDHSSAKVRRGAP